MFMTPDTDPPKITKILPHVSMPQPQPCHMSHRRWAVWKVRELEGYLYSRKTNREKTSVAELTMGVPVRHHLHTAYHVILGRACTIPP